MKLAFVIPAYNEEALIGKCVESVLAEVKRSGRNVDVVVVNNNSTDRTREIAASYEGARVVDELQKGLVSARDGGFRAMSAAIKRNWKQNQGVAGVNEVRFTIERDGRISTFEFVQRSGIVALDRESQAVLTHAKLPPLPPQFTEPKLVIRLIFD